MKDIIGKTWHLSLIIGLRFLGLFVVMSVLSAYAMELEGATTTLIGLAVGGYALTQALLQVPFGILSDKIGRKKTILIGLIIFAIGSIIAGLSNDIYMLLLGRFLQGAGAIGSVIIAMISDHVREDERAHAMATMGMVIALSFTTAMILGPILGGMENGVPNLFYLTAGMALLSIILLFTVVPKAPKITHSFSQEEAKVKDVFKDKDLVRMYVTFLFHSSTMAIAFFLIPLVLKDKFGLPLGEFWKVYLPAVFFGIIAMGPAAVFGEKYNKGKEVFLISIAFIAVAFLLMGFSESILLFGTGVVFFFIGFNMFEPLLQSFVSKFAKAHQKGAALGVANTFAYIGMGIGATLAGKIFEIGNVSAVAIVVLVVSIFWAIWIYGMRNPGLRGTIYLGTDIFDRDRLEVIKTDNGINDIYVNESEGVMVIKYDKEILDEDTIRGLMLKK
ncbi:MULTIDRUG-EFFLUX TRANSPORTER [hydrothermal vent metagenome]|uniref:MULTIDRUG-EFFLUX TRANSPORTER n=1 Tax=hydrothermal vent metagenome TaxID=652676 RepID=A0A1W1BHT7_9ZZZZ